MDEVGSIRVSLVDGARKPLPKSRSVLLRVLDGRKRQAVAQWVKGPSILVKNLRVFDNLDDLYTVLAYCDGCQDAGIYPVHLQTGTPVDASLMLAPSDAEFHFQPHKTFQSRWPRIARLLDAARYGELMERKPARQLGALLVMAAAIESIELKDGTSPLDRPWEVEWDLLFEDRFFAWVDAGLAGEIEKLAGLGSFAAEKDPGRWHPGRGGIGPATRSWKQTRFDVANVQLSFHENDHPKSGDRTRVAIEPDMDYYRDILAHGLLEVLPNRLTGGNTDPRIIYRLRWMAQRQEGLPDFTPPCTLA